MVDRIYTHFDDSLFSDTAKKMDAYHAKTSRNGRPVLRNCFVHGYEPWGREFESLRACQMDIIRTFFS